MKIENGRLLLRKHRSEDCIIHCIDEVAPLSQWYLLMAGDKIIGCAVLITNDFISRKKFYPN